MLNGIIALQHAGLILTGLAFTAAVSTASGAAARSQKESVFAFPYCRITTGGFALKPPDNLSTPSVRSYLQISALFCWTMPRNPMQEVWTVAPAEQKLQVRSRLAMWRLHAKRLLKPCTDHLLAQATSKLPSGGQAKGRDKRGREIYSAPEVAQATF